MNTTPPPAARRGALIFIFVTVVLDMLAFGIIIPVLPKLVEQFLNGDTARAAQVYGVFSMAWAAMQFMFSPLLGAMSDRYGRRPLILLSCFGLGVDFLRSEEHTSELQSLMRISYAVFCLKKKK